MRGDSRASAAAACGSERRVFPRTAAIAGPGLLHSEAGQELCLVRNISSGGGMVEGYCSRSQGEQIALQLNNDMLLSGTVAWVGNGRFGLQFDKCADVASLLDKQGALAPGRKPRLPRVEVGCTAFVRVGERLHQATVVDISQGGAKLELDLPLEAEDVSLSLPGLPALDGVVRWSEDGRAGVSFKQAIPFRELAKWLAQHQQSIRRTALTLGLITAPSLMMEAPAAAAPGESRGSLGVTATVTENCIVSSSSGQGQVTVVCTPGTHWSKVELAQRQAKASVQAKAAPADPAAPAPVQASAGSYVTITY